MFLSQVDLFGYSIQPTFRGKPKINTVLGGFISLLVIALFTLGFFYVGREIVERKNPISNVSAFRLNEALVSLKKVPLSFAMVSYAGEFLHLNQEFNRSARFGAGLYEIGTSQDGQVTFSFYNVPTVFCNKEILGEEYFETAKAAQEGIEYTLCLDFNNITALDGSKHPDGVPSIKNPYGTQNGTYLNVYIELCDQTKDSGCRKKIEEVGPFHFFMFHPEDILNISDNTNPLSTQVKALQTTAFVGLTFSQILHFNVNELVTDQGWILEQDQTEPFYTADAPIYNATQYSEADRVLGRCMIAVNLTKSIVSRRYMKLQELIANLGGFIKVVMMTFSFLLRNYEKWTLYSELTKIEVRSNILQPNSSGIMINNIVSSSGVPLEKKKPMVPSFTKFVGSLVSKNYAKKTKINWEDTLKYLDLVYLKKQFEEFSCLKPSNLLQNK